MQAYTEIGTGTISTPISVNSSQEAPLPTLLIASSDTIFLDDIDANHNYSLVNGISTPLEIAYLMRESKLFWINEMQELFMYHIHSSNKTKILELKGKPKGLSLDWLERSLYYVEGINNTLGSTVYKINLNHLDKNVMRNLIIYSTQKNISKIEISPLTRKIYWIETAVGEGHDVMCGNLDGTDVRQFFGPHNKRKRSIFDRGHVEDNLECNCPENVKVEPTFTIDHSGTENKPKLIFIDSTTKEVFASDKDGCACSVIANNTIVSKSFPLQRIKSDFGSLYWTNNDGVLYAFKKVDSNLLTKSVKANDVNIYGKHMQPYPPKECLSPRQYSNFTPKVKLKSYYSLTLQMPKVQFDENCMNTSTPTAIYTIKYYELLRPDDTLRYLSTFNETFELTDLKPFTKYSVSAAVSNHFTKMDEILFGKPLILRTSPGGKIN